MIIGGLQSRMFLLTRTSPSLQFCRRTKNLRLSTIAAAGKSVVPFKLTDIGEGIAEVELLKWFVKEGDTIRSFDRVCEVQSDKATVEITSRYGGVVKILHHLEGSIVKVGSSLVDIETDHINSITHSANPNSLSVSASIVREELVEDNLMDVTSINSLPAAPTLFSREAKLPASYDKRSFTHKENGEARQLPLTTPAVRKLAKEMGLDLFLLRGTGPGGRILKEDLNVELDRGEQILTSHSSSTATAQLLSESKQISKAQSVGTHMSSRHTVPLRGIQRLMARSMTESLKVPQLTFTDDVRCEEMMLARKRAKARQGAEKGSASIMPLIIKATSMALKQYPIMNCSVLCPDCLEIVYNHDHNIGIAMDTPKGLLVPVIKQVQLKSMSQIASELSELQKKASLGTLTEGDMQGGTFTLSNIGSIGGTCAVPLVLVPQVAIGAMGKIQTLPRYPDIPFSDSALQVQVPVPVMIMSITWSADHRVVDGASVARFSNTWKGYIEQPSSMLSDLV